MNRTILLAVASMAAVAATPKKAMADSNAANWNRFRGPGGSGVAGGARPPERPGKSSLAWKVPVPPGLSSPVLGAGRLLLTAIDEGRLVTLAFDARTGELAWRREAPDVPIEPVHRTSSPAAPTPLVEDDGSVVVYFGSFGLLAYDRDGNERWRRAIPTPKSLYGTACSPVGFEDLVILVLDDDADLPESRLSRSKVAAFHKATGEIAWETPRPFVRSGWSTPTIWRHGDGVDLVVLGSGRVSGYDPRTGEEKWFATGFSRETIAAPVSGDGHVFVSSAQLGGGADEKVDPAPFWAAVMGFDADGDGRLERSEMTRPFTFPLRPELPPGHPGFGIPLPDDEARRSERLDGMFGWIDKDRDGFWTEEEFTNGMSNRPGKPVLMAIRPGGRGDITESHVSWQLHRSIPEIPSPLCHEGRIYLVRNGGLLAAADTATGELLYRERLGASGQYSASPVLADGRLYLVSNLGLLSVVKAGPTFELDHQFDLGEPVFVTPSLDEDSLYVRSEGHLLAFRARE